MERDWARERVFHLFRVVILVLVALYCVSVFATLPAAMKHPEAWSQAKAYAVKHRAELEKNARDYDKAIVKSEPGIGKLLSVPGQTREQMLRMALMADSLTRLAIITVLYLILGFVLIGRVRVDIFHHALWGTDLLMLCFLLNFTWGFRSEVGMLSPFDFLPVVLVFANTVGQERHTGLISAVVAALAYGVLFILRGTNPPLGVPVPWGGFILVEGLIFAAGSLGLFQGLFGEAARPEQRMDKDKLLEQAYRVSREQAQEKEKKEFQLNETLRRVTSLVEISSSMASTHDLGELLNLIITKAREEMNSSMAFLMLLVNDTLVVEHSYGISDLTKGILQCRVGEGLLGEVLKSGQPVRLTERDSDPRFASLSLSKEKFRTVLCVPLQTPQDKKSFGVLCVGNILTSDCYTSEHEGYLKILAGSASISIKNVNLFADLERSYYEIILALAQAIEAKDIYTRGHVGRVMKFSLRIARMLRLSDEEIKLIEKAAILHDIGKIAIPDRILQKQGPLDPEERALMNQHAEASRNILKDLSSISDKVLDLVMHHHERYDGKGYPHGLEKKDIPLGAMVIAVADTFDAMTTDRPYRKGFPQDEALRRMRDCMGTQFDPEVLTAFLSLFGGESSRGPQIDLERREQ